MQDFDKKAKAKKLASLKSAMKALSKSKTVTNGENLIQILGDLPEQHYDCIPTGYISLDSACTGQGIARGRIVELFGNESCGKSLIAQKVVAACQAHGGLCAYVDLEFTFDPQFARKLGVNTDELVISQPDCLQDAFIVIDSLIEAGVDVIVLDSIAALVPKEELEAEAAKQSVGLVARYMSQFLRRVTSKLAHSGSILVCINQTREKIGVMFGDNTTTGGGRKIA